jgi:hypothetical protein
MLDIITENFKRAVRAVKAKGEGGIEDEKCVIVRAQLDSLVLIGIGGNEVSTPARYGGETQALMVSLTGLRAVANALGPHDWVRLQVRDAGLTIFIQTHRSVGRRLVPGFSSECVLLPKTPLRKILVTAA